MRSRDDIVLKRDVGAGEEICSTMGSVTVHGNIHEGANVSGRDGVSALNLAKNVTITSVMGEINVRHVASHCNLEGRDGVSTLDIADHVTITATMGTINILQVGNHCTLVGRDGVRTSNILGSGNRLKASLGDIKVDNIIGGNNIIDGRDGVKAGVIGEQNRVSCCMGKIHAEAVRANSTLTGRDGVYIRQEAHVSASLISSMGTVDSGKTDGMVPTSTVSSTSTSTSTSTPKPSSMPGTLFNATSSLSEYSIHLSRYIESIKGKTSFTDQLKDLQLTEEEEQELEQFVDPISMEIMNVPVSLNERFYDISTLIGLKEKKDFYTSEPFELRDIQSARSKFNEIQDFINKITSKNTSTLVNK